MLRSVTIRSSGLLRAVGVCNILIVTESSILILWDHVVLSKITSTTHSGVLRTGVIRMVARTVARTVARNVVRSVARNV